MLGERSQAKVYQLTPRRRKQSASGAVTLGPDSGCAERRAAKPNTVIEQFEGGDGSVCSPPFYSAPLCLKDCANEIHKAAWSKNAGKSKLRDLFYNFRYRIGEICLARLCRASALFPYRRWLGVSRALWRVDHLHLLWRLSQADGGKYRSRSLGNEIPDPANGKALVWRAWQNFARGVLETAQVMHFSKEAIIATVDLKGEEHLQHALERGKGVLALSAHLGGFTLIGARLGAAGYPFSVVVKQPRDERFARLIDDYRAPARDSHDFRQAAPRSGARHSKGAARKSHRVWSSPMNLNPAM